MSKDKIYIAGCGGMLGEAFYKKFKKNYDLKCTDIDLNENWLSYLDFRDPVAYQTDVNDFKKLQRLELNAGEIDENEFQDSILEQQVENVPEGEIKIQLDDGSGSLKEIIIKYK